MSNSYLNYFEEVSLGNHDQKFTVNKFGESPSGLQTTPTDIWPRANVGVTQQIWLAPTAANIHTIKSSSAADDTAGTGINSVIVYYLPTWDTRETSETVTGDIATGVAMQNTAVMINRMKVVPQSTTTSVGGNTGTITATAAAPSATTITAVILPNDGQTEQAIFGFPSIQTFLLSGWGVHIDKSSGAVASADFQLRFNPNPDVQELAFIRKGDLSVQSTGSNAFHTSFKYPQSHAGPGIMKIQGISSANGVDGEAGFSGVLVDN